MTPKERAERIRLFLAGVTEYDMPSLIDADKFIIAQIEEAQGEALKDCWNSRLSELAEIEEQKFNAGFNAAREKAAEIADRASEDWDQYANKEIGRVRRLLTPVQFIADRIRSMKPELKDIAAESEGGKPQ